MATIADLESEVTAGMAANRDGDYATAQACFENAKAILATFPDSVHGGRGGQEIKWRPQELDTLIDSMRRKKNSRLGVQQTLVNYVSETTSDGY
jgi:hypothetical protein